MWPGASLPRFPACGPVCLWMHAQQVTRLPEESLGDIEEKPQPLLIRFLDLPGQDAAQVLGGQLEFVQVEKFGQGNAESSRQGFDAGERRVPSPPLDFSNVLEGQAGELGQFFLGHVAIATNRPDFLAKKFLNIVHASPPSTG